MMQTARFHERRRHQRLPLRCPVALLSSHGWIETTTEDLSPAGFMCFLGEPIAPGQHTQCRITLTRGDAPLDRPATLMCRVSIVRVVPRLQRRYEVGCRIDTYSVVRS